MDVEYIIGARIGIVVARRGLILFGIGFIVFFAKF